ncbi:MAG TPA: sigma-70 family RNA polymerase sigma factor [Rudaea sp.]|nr:sigma-70 family RNA polymerase sigma factor [Rudaea sp.]
MTETAGEERDGGIAARVYAECYVELTRFLQRLCGEAALAEDLAQEAGMRLVSAMRREQIEQPRAFLFHVAANLARDQLRRRIVAQSHADALADSGQAPGADQIAAVHQEVAIVAKAISTLPARARAVLQLARIEGYSQKEIAAQLGITPKTVENHLTRALAQLATRLRSGGRQ